MKQPGKKTLLVGLGNPLSGDDGFGPCVLERLHAAGLDCVPDVSLVDAGTDLLNYIESFSEYDRVVLIDAILDHEFTGLMKPDAFYVLQGRRICHCLKTRMK